MSTTGTCGLCHQRKPCECDQPLNRVFEPIILPPVQTHGPDCWRHHPECCKARMERLDKVMMNTLIQLDCDPQRFAAFMRVKRIIEGRET